MRIPLIYNLRSLWQRRTTTAATIVGIGLVVLTFVGMLALANGFRAAMISTGRMDNVIVIRAGADAELSSGIGREQAAIIKALPQVAQDDAGAPLATADVYVGSSKDGTSSPAGPRSSSDPVSPGAWRASLSATSWSWGPGSSPWSGTSMRRVAPSNPRSGARTNS
jgi:hypothetical protein